MKQHGSGVRLSRSSDSTNGPEAEDPLFADWQRSDPRPSQHRESTFEFLDRVDQPYWERVRNTMNQWFAVFPDEARDPKAVRADLSARFRSRDWRQSLASEWELYLHELFRAMGFSVEVDPKTQDGRTPDLRLYLDEKTAIFVEAAIHFPSNDDARSRALLEDFKTAIEKAFNGSDSVLLRIHVESWGSQPIAGAELGRQMAEEFRHEGRSVRRLTTENWIIEIRAESSLHSGPVAAMVSEFGVRTAVEATLDPVRKRLKKKGDKYKLLNAPLVVALDIEGMYRHIGANYVEQAMFGSNVVTIGPSGELLGSATASDGVLRYNDRPARSNVSALLLTQRFATCFAAERTPDLYLNPDAEFPIEPGLIDVRTLAMVDGSFKVVHEGRSGAEIIGLPAEWPGH